MEEEKRHAMFASFRAGKSPKEVIEFLNYPKSTVYDQTDEFVAEVKRKVNEDGNKSYAKLAAEMGCSKQIIANTINKDLGYSSYKKRHRMILTGVAVGEPPLPLEPGLVAPSSPDCKPLDYFFWGMVENKTNKHAHNTLDSSGPPSWRSLQSLQHRLEMVVAADGGYIEK
ncbi:Uncharacterized protein FKW44_021714 [Caligus rogercresseyi]|uniref:Uncharacterized protein n=1 Tax=Caligus rogercresseyi TaxID=217165 RepID=A0A7T8GS34_CALRO|nr:Uncharacterized protein FKW44_021714 [Caligus rogercresseyi]